MLQEQYWSAYTKSSPIPHAWTLIESTAINDNGQPRTAIYVNNNLFPASKITPMALPINDVSAITLNTLHEKLSLFVNIYNPCDKNILSELQENLRKNFNTRDYNMIIIGGDFNTHHPLWNPNGYMHHDDEANTLVETSESSDFEQNEIPADPVIQDESKVETVEPTTPSHYYGTRSTTGRLPN